MNRRNLQKSTNYGISLVAWVLQKISFQFPLKKILRGKKENFHIFLLLFLCLLPVISSQAETTYLPNNIQVEMLTALLSERAEINDKVEVKLFEPINLPSERIFVPIESIVSGRVVEVQEAKRALRRGRVKVVFERIYYPNGYILFADGFLIGMNKKLEKAKNNSNSQTVYQQNNENIENKGVKGKLSFKDKLLTVGKVGAGALLGGPIGAATAAGTLIFDKGGKVRIKEGDTVFIHLEKLGIMSQELDVRGEINSPPSLTPQPRY